jgi:Sortase domain
MSRLSSGMVVPLLLAVAGVTLIIVGQLDLDRPPVESLEPIADPSSPVALATPTPSPTQEAPSDPGATPRPTPEPTPTPTPPPDDWIATQIQIESIGLNVAVRQSRDPSTDDFPPLDAAYILRNSSQPGRGTNSYMFAHAWEHLFKPLWNVQLGAVVKVRMSDGAVLRYVVSEIHANVSCPDDRADPHPSPPLALRLAGPGCEEGAAWTQPTDHERLTLQTSQGFNRNWGELIVVADPVA